MAKLTKRIRAIKNGYLDSGHRFSRDHHIAILVHPRQTNHGLLLKRRRRNYGARGRHFPRVFVVPPVDGDSGGKGRNSSNSQYDKLFHGIRPTPLRRRRHRNTTPPTPQPTGGPYFRATLLTIGGRDRT